MRQKQGVIFVLVVIVVTTLTAILSLKFESNKFFDLTLTNVITYSISIYVAYYLVQERTDNRAQKQNATDLILRLQKIVNGEDPELYSNNSNSTKVRNHQRIISNKITILCKYCEELGFHEEKEYLFQQLSSYKILVDEHQEDPDYLSKSHSQIKKAFSNIDQCCDTIVFKMFSKTRSHKNQS